MALKVEGGGDAAHRQAKGKDRQASGVTLRRP
jgi:hypothetical protein